MNNVDLILVSALTGFALGAIPACSFGAVLARQAHCTAVLGTGAEFVIDAQTHRITCVRVTKEAVSP